MNPLAQVRHPAWLTAVATLVSYGVAILVVFVLLFVVPFLAMTAL